MSSGQHGSMPRETLFLRNLFVLIRNEAVLQIGHQFHSLHAVEPPNGLCQILSGENQNGSPRRAEQQHRLIMPAETIQLQPYFSPTGVVERGNQNRSFVACRDGILEHAKLILLRALLKRPCLADLNIRSHHSKSSLIACRKHATGLDSRDRPARLLR